MDSPNQKQLRSFGFTLGGAFLVLGAFVLWRGKSDHRNLFAGAVLGLGLLLCFWGLVSPRTLSVVYKPWMGFAHFLGGIMTHVLMTVFFFTILLPFTLVRFKDPLRLRRGAASYWEPHKNSEPTLERFQRPF